MAIFYKNKEVNNYNNDIIDLRKKHFNLQEYDADAQFFEEHPPNFLANNSHSNNMNNQAKIYIRTIADLKKINIYKSLVAKGVIKCNVPFNIRLIKGAPWCVLCSVVKGSKIGRYIIIWR